MSSVWFLEYSTRNSPGDLPNSGRGRFSDSKTVQFNALTGGSIGQIAAEYTLGDFPSQTVKWLHYDRLGNVMNKSGSAGTLTDTYDQDAYGNVISNITTGQWASSMSGRHLTTKEFDGDANLYYFWQRWYDPQVGRFISQDPFPALNVYVFTGNNPLTFVDPNGLQPTPQPQPLPRRTPPGPDWRGGGKLPMIKCIDCNWEGFWDCMKDKFKGWFAPGPGPIGACGGVCSYCLYAPSQANPACWVCLACIVTYVGLDVIDCLSIHCTVEWE